MYGEEREKYSSERITAKQMLSEGGANCHGNANRSVTGTAFTTSLSPRVPYVCLICMHAYSSKCKEKKNLSFAHSSPMYGLAFVVLFCLIIVFVVHFIQCMPCLCGIFFLFPFFCSFNCVCWRHRGEQTVKSIAVRSVFFSLGRTNFLLFKSM